MHLEHLLELKSDFAEILVKSIKEWAEKEVIPYRAQIDDDFEIAERALRKLFLDIGMQKLALPEAKGGPGINPKELPAVLLRSFEEIGKADAGIGFVLSATISTSLASMESEALDYISEKLSRGLCRIAIFPPQFGESDFEGLQLAKATTTGDRVRVRASGRPLNSGYDADVFAVFCDYDGVSIALVDAKDVERGGLVKSTGLVASRNCDVKISAEVEKSKILTGNAWKKLLTYFNLCISALCVGSAFDSCRIVKEWAERRTIRGKLLRDNTVDAAVMASALCEAMGAKAIAQVLAKIMVEGRGVDEVHAFSIISALKCSESALRAADRAMELMASQGYAREGLLEKQWRDSRSIKTILNPYHLLLELSVNYFGAKLW